MLAVNHLAPYVLLRTLAAVLDRARFIIVGADPQGLARRPVDLDDLRFADSGRLATTSNSACSPPTARPRT